MVLHDTELHDFADTAALLAAMDLVITIDTSVAHLAAAMGRPTWIMIPFDPDWRWLLARAGSPWYPSARLFRQPKPGDWADVIGRVRGALEQALPASPQVLMLSGEDGQVPSSDIENDNLILK